VSGAADAKGGTFGESGKRKRNDGTEGTLQRNSEHRCGVTPKVARYKEGYPNRKRKPVERLADKEGEGNATKQNYRSVL
jgi:hypothetical protein